MFTYIDDITKLRLCALQWQYMALDCCLSIWVATPVILSAMTEALLYPCPLRSRLLNSIVSLKMVSASLFYSLTKPTNSSLISS